MAAHESDRSSPSTDAIKALAAHDGVFIEESYNGQIVYVLILAELYRTLIFYLREHRVSVALIMETAIVTTVNELILIGHDGPPQTYLAIPAL